MRWRYVIVGIVSFIVFNLFTRPTLLKKDSLLVYSFKTRALDYEVWFLRFYQWLNLEISPRFWLMVQVPPRGFAILDISSHYSITMADKINKYLICIQFQDSILQRGHKTSLLKSTIKEFLTACSSIHINWYKNEAYSVFPNIIRLPWFWIPFPLNFFSCKMHITGLHVEHTLK